MGRCNASLTTITLKWLHKNQTGMRYRTLWFVNIFTWNSKSDVVLAIFVRKKGVKLPFLRGFCRICTWSCMFRASRFLHKFKHIITLHLTQRPEATIETASNGHSSPFPEIANFSPGYRPLHRIFESQRNRKSIVQAVMCTMQKKWAILLLTGNKYSASKSGILAKSRNCDNQNPGERHPVGLLNRR